MNTIQNKKKYDSHSSSIYGGTIEIEDFSTFSPNKRRISHQIDAMNLPQTLNTYKKQKNKEKKYKQMTLEELRKMKIISNTNGRPCSALTDEKWQKEFMIRRLFIKPHKNSCMKMRGAYTNESGIWNSETQGTYHGRTNWQEYSAYINDVLTNIRSGQIDFCYYIYQIMDLLPFHYNDLRTKYCDGYWEVWLDKESGEIKHG